MFHETFGWTLKFYQTRNLLNSLLLRGSNILGRSATASPQLQKQFLASGFKRFAAPKNTSVITASRISHEGMVLISTGKFIMGASDNDGGQDEYPRHEVKLSAFWIDITEVTNSQFEKFIDATGYVTTAERKADWPEIQKQLPSGTPKTARK